VVDVLHLWAIPLGAAALCLPLAIHLLTRPKPVRMPLSTLRFVREALAQKRARSRLRDWLVLALRTLAVAVLAAALARPLIGTHPAAEEAPGQSTRIVVLDVSQSMAAGDHGIQAWERARAIAARHLQFSPGLRANLILAGASAQTVLDVPSGNFTALAEELNRAAVRPQRADAKAALEAAGRMLAGSPPASGLELVVVSDFQRGNWATADFDRLPQPTRIVLESVAPQQQPPNLAIVRAGCAGPNAAGQATLLEVEVANFTSGPQTVTVGVEFDSQLHRLQGVCPAQARITLSRSLVPSKAGWQSGTARLAGVRDSLSADNVRFFVVDVRRPPTYALITRQPAGQRPASSYYLERALVPLDSHQHQGPKLVRLDPLRLELDSLAPCELIVLDHPGKLSTATAGLLASLVRRGRALLYLTAENIDATNLKLLLDAAGTAVELPVEFFPASGSQPRRDLFLADARRGEAPFAVFGESLPGLLAPLRFAGGLASRPVGGGLADDVLAHYNDRSACLVIAACGAGQLGILNVDLQISTLPASPIFVPWLAELTRRLLERGGASTEVACGEAAAVYLPPDAGPLAGLSLTDPDPPAAETLTDTRLTDEGAAVLWRLRPDPPGIYQVERGGEVVGALAAVIPAEESDLQPLSADVLKRRLAGGRDVRFHSIGEQPGEHDTLWVWLLMGCVACMLGEIVVLNSFRT
jgi:hypothetical protein